MKANQMYFRDYNYAGWLEIWADEDGTAGMILAPQWERQIIIQIDGDRFDIVRIAKRLRKSLKGRGIMVTPLDDLLANGIDRLDWTHKHYYPAR